MHFFYHKILLPMLRKNYWFWFLLWSLIFPAEKFVETGCLVIKRPNYDLILLSAAATMFLSSFFSLKIGPSCEIFSATRPPAARKLEKNSIFFSFFVGGGELSFSEKNERYGPREYQIFSGKNSHCKIFLGGCPSCSPCCSEDMATWSFSIFSRLR